MRTAVAPVLLFLAALSLSWTVSGRAPLPVRDDAWFDCDSSWVYANITSIDTTHRTRKHPVFSLLVYPVVKAISWSGVGKPTSVRIVFSVMAGLWALLLYAVLRGTLARRLDAAVFTLLGLSTSGFLFWSWISETFIAASVTILLALWAFQSTGRWRVLLHWLAAISTLAVTVTNWFAAVLAAVMRLPRRTAVIVTIGSLALVAAVAFAQSRVVRTQDFFLDVHAQARTGASYVNHESGGSVLNRWRIAVVGSAVLPGLAPRVVRVNSKDSTMLSAQTVHGSWAWAGVAGLWLVLLTVGIVATVRAGTPFGRYLVILAAAHVALHTVYGYETFLYSLHIVPILIVLAAQAVRVHRVGALALAGLVAALALIHNVGMLQRALAALPGIGN